MLVEYGGGKECEAYKNYVKEPHDRKYRREFLKYFSSDKDRLLKDSVTLHQRLVSFKNAELHNKCFIRDNSIQKKAGTKDNDRIILKVRVNHDGYRKFFYHKLAEDAYLLTKDWVGQFDKIEQIYVFDVNKHDY